MTALVVTFNELPPENVDLPRLLAKHSTLCLDIRPSLQPGVIGGRRDAKRLRGSFRHR